MQWTRCLIAWLNVCVLASSCTRSDHETGSTTNRGASAEPPLVVFAAASTAGPLSTIAERFGDLHGVTVRTSFAASSTLARQIEHGAGADVFISADAAWMDYLAERGLVLAQTRADLVSNSLVVIAAPAAACSIRFDPAYDLSAAFRGRIALGDPEHVPVGRYARAALEHYGWWQAIAPRLLTTEDTRATVGVVERGEADIGIVYGSDAIHSSRVWVVTVIPPSSHPPIRYPIAACSSRPIARRFIDACRSAESIAVFEGAGFAAVSGDRP
jgi:molybdate transport system substrate-binding protein